MEFFTSMAIPVELILGLALPLLLFIAAIHQLWRPSSNKKKHVIQQEKELLPLPPGRFGLPFIGETLEYHRAHKEGIPWKFIEDRISAYGETFKTNILTCPTVVLASPLGNKTAFSNSHTSWPYTVAALMGRKSLVAVSGPPATRIRNALMMFLRPESLQRYMSRVDLIFLGFITEHLEGKSEVFLFPLMKKLIFSIACEVFIGLQDGEDQELLLLDFNNMVKGMIELPIDIPGTRYNKALAAADVLRKSLQVWIDKRRRDMAAGLVIDHQDILSGFLMYKDEHGQPFSDEEIKDNILMLLFAGHDTSSIVATMICKYLASNPDIMDQVYHENKEIAASKAPDELLNWGDIQKMKLSWRVAQESMRLVPPSQGSFRLATRDMSFNGFRIPKSWKIMWSPHSTHRNPKYFPDPHKFNPSRFEGAGPAPFTFVPFSRGPRMCPGNEFARMEILMIIHRLVTRFSWTLKDPNEAIVVDPMPLPVKGLPILLEPRIA